MKVFKLGFIGGSIDSIAGYPHFCASQLDGRWELVAGAFSPDQVKNAQTAEVYQVSRFYDDWRQLLDKEHNNLDAIAILLPTPMHFDVIKAVLHYGLPIICEKSLVSSMADFDQLNQMVSAQQFLAVTNNYSGYPLVRELRHKIQAGDLGKLINIYMEMPQESFLRPPKNVLYPQKWRLNDEYIPTICLDLGVHLHHLSYFLTGLEPTAVIGEFNNFSHYSVIDDVRLLLKYPNQMRGSFWMSKTALGHRNGLTIHVYGDKGSARWVQEDPEKLFFADVNGHLVTLDRGSQVAVCNQKRYSRMTAGHPAGFVEAFANVYMDIADALTVFLETGTLENDYVYGMEHAGKGLALFQCAKKSFESANWLELN